MHSQRFLLDLLLLSSSFRWVLTLLQFQPLAGLVALPYHCNCQIFLNYFLMTQLDKVVTVIRSYALGILRINILITIDRKWYLLSKIRNKSIVVEPKCCRRPTIIYYLYFLCDNKGVSQFRVWLS